MTQQVHEYRRWGAAADGIAGGAEQAEAGTDGAAELILNGTAGASTLALLVQQNRHQLRLAQQVHPHWHCWCS